MITIALAKRGDEMQIAKIHKTEISKGFLSSLSLAFLKRFFRGLIESPASFCVVAKESNEVIGFMAGVSDMNKFYAYFLWHYFFQSFFILLPKAFSSFKKILESLFYPTKESSLPKAELLTIAVAKEFQGKGVASMMLPIFVAEMEKRNVAVFKVVVGEELKNAIKFYEKNNFVFLRNTAIHGKNQSRVYIYNL